MSKRDAKVDLRQKIKTAIEQMNQEDEFIDSVENLREILAAKHEIVA